MTTTTNTRTWLDDVAPELVGILANPEDDTPRLIYADWLEDHGDPERAEFIRVQVELTKAYGTTLHGIVATAFPTHRCIECGAFWRFWFEVERWSLVSASAGKCCDNADMGRQIELIPPDFFALFRRQHNLLSVGGRLWTENLIPDAVPSHWSTDNPVPYFVLPGPVYINIAFRRGFITEIHAPLAVLQKHLPALVLEHPIERVLATDKEPEPFSKNGETPTDDNPPVEFVWWWTNSAEPTTVEHLPNSVWHALEGYLTTSSNVDKDYPTVEAAHAALSEALLRLAKKV